MNNGRWNHEKDRAMTTVRAAGGAELTGCLGIETTAQALTQFVLEVLNRCRSVG